MATTGPMNDMPRFAKVRLQHLAEAITISTAPGDPLTEAGQLRLRALHWTDAASRRAALALRIALLSRPLAQASALPDVETRPETDPLPEPETPPAPEAEARPAKTRAPRPERPGLALKDATSLLAALGAGGEESWSNPDQTSAGRGMEMSMPDAGNSSDRDLADLPPESPKAERAPTPPAPPQITMTDLSLSILTGEFRPSPPPLQITFPEDEETAETTKDKADLQPESQEADSEANIISTAHRQETSRILEDATHQSATPLADRPPRSRRTKAKPKAAKAG